MAYASVKAPITPAPIARADVQIMLDSRTGHGNAEAIEVHHQHQQEKKCKNADSIGHSASL